MEAVLIHARDLASDRRREQIALCEAEDEQDYREHDDRFFIWYPHHPRA